MPGEIARAKLIDLVREHGRSLGPDPDDAMALLRRELAGYKRECAVLIDAMRDGVPDAITTASRGVPLASVIARLATRLQQDRGLGAEWAWWAVESWAAALNATPSVRHSAFEPLARPEAYAPAVDPLPSERSPRPAAEDPARPSPVDGRQDAGGGAFVRDDLARAPQAVLVPYDPVATERQIRLAWITTIVWGAAGALWSIFLGSVRFWSGMTAFGFVIYSAAISAGLAWGLQRRSRVAAVLLVAIQIPNIFGAFATQQVVFVLISFAFLAIFLIGARAIFRYRAAHEARLLRDSRHAENQR